jgi:hypothetical protein
MSGTDQDHGGTSTARSFDGSNYLIDREYRARRIRAQ